MTFNEGISVVFRKAKETSRLCYLYQRPNGTFYSSYEHRNNWLFRAYPGGRRELSIAGKKIAQELGIL